MANSLTNLMSLFVSGINFKKLHVDKKAVFKLMINNEGDLTFAAFIGIGHVFDSDPAFILTPFAPSSFTWNKNIFLGDQKIGMNKLKKIWKKISNTHPDVIFIPRLDNEFANQVAYEIFVGNHSEYDMNIKLPNEKFLALAFTNPSPPRGSEDD